MSSQISSSVDESSIQNLYQQLLAGWNRRSAEDFAALFEEEGHVVGFDGSLMNGREEIRSVIHDIFIEVKEQADDSTFKQDRRVPGDRAETNPGRRGRLAGLVPGRAR